MYRESYLRFSSRIFSLDNFHESLHLTNHAVQCKYTNVEERDKSLPHDNMWHSNTFQTWLKQMGEKDKWNEVIFPGMREGIVCAMLASQDVMDRRQNTFEIYGADFVISEDFKPWLLEINCNPAMSSSTSVTSRMCPRCMEDLVKVIVDRRRDPTANTGLFDLVYRQILPSVPPYLGMNLSVRGRKVFRNRNTFRLPTRDDKSKDYKNNAQMWLDRKQEFVKSGVKRSLIVPTDFPKQTPAGIHKGPVIEDLIYNLNKSVTSPKLPKIEVVKITKLDSGMKKCDAVSKNKNKKKAPNQKRKQ